jgi:hypothetical protein
MKVLGKAPPCALPLNNIIDRDRIDGTGIISSELIKVMVMVMVGKETEKEGGRAISVPWRY